MAYKRENRTKAAAKTRSKARTVTGLVLLFITVFVAGVIIFVKKTPDKDTTPPQIHGAVDLSIEQGSRVSYRNGVSVTDDKDESPTLSVDASGVNLYTPGVYDVIYTAKDSSGNESSVTVKLTVTEAVEQPPEAGSSEGNNQLESEFFDSSFMAEPVILSEEYINELSDKILSEIIKPDMSKRSKASAIYDYVYGHVKYIGTSDKTNWLIGAYVGFMTGKGDCYNYYACSKALLTRAGIPNVDVERAGGTTDHYWNLVDVGEGYHHFDACPHPSGYPIKSFLITEAQAREYTERCKSVLKNYYVYDYEACPVKVEGTPTEQSADPATDTSGTANPNDPAATDPSTAIPANPPENPTPSDPANPDAGDSPGQEGPQSYEPGEYNPYDPSTWD